MEFMILPLKRYVDFSGRSQRMEYWMFVLFLLLVFVGGAFVGAALGDLSVTFLVLAILYLGIFIPLLAVQVRRFHDQDLSGWMVLLGFIPYIGGLIILVFMCIDGTPGSNRFGPDPKGRGDLDARIFA